MVALRTCLRASAAVMVVGTPAAAQRAGENVVSSAQDAFGSSVGNERVGLYTPFGARGFSPIQAGNVRIEGMFFDYQADLNERVTASSNVRVGLTAQGYPFPAPTGVADFSLRKPGTETVLSVSANYGPMGGARVDLDGQLPLNDKLGVAGGIGFNREALFYGGSRNIASAAAVVRYRPVENVEFMPFWSVTDSSGGEAQPVIFTQGAFLPPEIERRRYFGAPWARNEFRNINYGLLTNVTAGDWTFRSGLFRSLIESKRNFNNLFLGVDREGNAAQRRVLAEADREFGSVSGEGRLSRRFVDGNRLHQVHLAVRGREQRRRYGGGRAFDYGPGRIDQPITAPQPVFSFGPQSRDYVSQYTGGIGYEGRWRNVGELTLGLQRTTYRKDVILPAGQRPPSKASPWLYNGALSIYASPSLVLYAGYTKGLEESPVAPPDARNRDEAPPALLTRQMDAGFRWTFAPNLRLVAGVFDVRKPYFALDNTSLFTNLGEVRHRGVELSLAGQITPRLNIVAGTVFLDAEVSGEAVEQGLVGPKPVTSIARISNGAVNWNLPWIEGASLDVGYESTSGRIANRLNTLKIPPRYVWSLGGRYRFNVAGKPTTLRALVQTVNNDYGWNNIGEGFYYNFPRRFTLGLVTDI